MNTPVNFELAKLLKEKGFDGNYFHYWNMVNHSGEWKVDTRIWEYTDNYIEAPTIADVVMWLYEKYGIWIFSKKENNLFQSFIQHPESINNWFSKFYNSPTQAYEAAIEYYLTTLP